MEISKLAPKEDKKKALVNESSKLADKDIQCYNCQGFGHFAYQCPLKNLHKAPVNESSKPAGKGVQCYNCQGFGHFAYQCPLKKLHIGKTIDEISDSDFDIPEEVHLHKAPVNGSSKPADKGVQCYNCQGFGHFAYQCPLKNLHKAPVNESSKLADKGVQCYNCQGFGHFAYQCPLKKLHIGKTIDETSDSDSDIPEEVHVVDEDGISNAERDLASSVTRGARANVVIKVKEFEDDRKFSASRGAVDQQDCAMTQKGRKKVGDTNTAETSKQSGSKIKTPKSLMPEPKIVKKSLNSSTSNAKKKGSQNTEHKGASNVHIKKENYEGPETKVKDQKDERNKEKIDAMIFMCNAKTKSDCFRYMVMGLPQSKKEIVATIKPGLKLFLYDFDAKLVYGIYKATSSGGMNLERAAFNGSYPAQVRFKVHMDCMPISEGSFKKAIMGNSNGDKIKFNTELTVQQVKKLTNLFQPSPHSPQQVPMPLVPLRPIMPSIEAQLHRPHEEILARSQKEAAPIQRETAPLDILSFGEKEYRMLGLRQRSMVAIPPAIPPSIPTYPSKTESETNLSKRIMAEGEYKRLETVQLATQPAYYDRYLYDVPRSEAETSRLHSAHAANALSDYNRSRQHGDIGDYDGSLPVSSRYSFAGLSFSNQ